MKSICFFFQLHQALQLKRYRFFEIGNDHYYYNDFADEDAIRYLADNCYLPANRTLLEMIHSSNGKFKVAFAISGVMLEQLEQYAPEVIDSFKELAQTGAVEFLGETYAHGLSSIYDENEFKAQVQEHSDRIHDLFGQRPTTFLNTEMIYSDEIGALISKLGFKGAIMEGAKAVLGWKSPNYVYKHPYAGNLALLPRNSGMSDNILFKFSDWGWDQFPLTAEKYIGWVSATPEEEKVMTIGMSYNALGLNNRPESGIFDFMKALPYHALMQKISFATPSEIIEKNKPTDTLSTGEPISWADEEKDLTAFCGNDLQYEAIHKLYAVGERVRLCTDKGIKYDWMHLQSCDHFYYMSTKHFTGNAVAHTGQYESPYEAFMNYMNVLSDFLQRVDEQYPTTIENEELNGLLKTIKNQETKISELKAEVKKLKGKETKKETGEENTTAKKTATKTTKSTKKA